VLGKRVSLDVVQRVGDDLARVDAPVPLQVGGLDPVLQRPAQLERERRAPAPDDQAAQPAGIQRRGDKRRPGADVGPDDVRVLEPEGVGDANEERAHRPWRQQRVATLGMTEPGRSTATRWVCSASRDQVGSKASRLSGHGLSNRA
jgi:hypothetical protein